MITPAFMVIAHRGASAYAPENTFAAFDLALRLGARHIELDVASTLDGHLVVIHDDTVERTTGGAGPVAGYTLAALRELDAGAWFGAAFAGERIPLLDEVLERYKGRACLHIEIKGRAKHLAQRSAASVRRHGMADRVVVTSFQQAQLEEIRAYAPELPCGWLVAEADAGVIAQARRLGLSRICPRAGTLTPERVQRLHAQGFTVRAWGVGSEELMRRVVRSGADGMTIDFPDKLIAYLRLCGRRWV